MEIPTDESGLRTALEAAWLLRKRLKIRLALAQIKKEAGRRGPGRPRLNLPVTRERVLELHRQGLSSRKMSRQLTAEAGVFVSRDFVYAIIKSEALCGQR